MPKRYTFIFGSEEENKEFMKQPIREQFDFYQNIIKEISNEFIKPNIMFVGFFGWKWNEYLQKLSEKAKKLLNPDSQLNQFALSNRHFIQSSLDLLSKRLYSKIELLTQSYISMDFKISNSLQKYQRLREPENPVFSKKIKLESNKDIGSRSTECLNSSIFAYIDTLINYIDFLGSPVQSVNDYTTNLFHTLCDSIKWFNEALLQFYNELVQGTHYQKFFQDDFYVQEKNSTEFNNTVDKVLSADFSSLQIDDSHFEEAKLPQRDESAKQSDSDSGTVKINSDYDLLQNQLIESIGQFADSDHLPDFIFHPKLAIEDNFLKSEITKLTLFGQLSVNLADMIRSLKNFLKVYEGKIEKTKSEFAGYVNVSELHPLIKTMTDVYHNSNIFIRCEGISRVFLSLRDMSFAELEKKYTPKGGESFGNVFCREITFLKLHLEEIFGDGDLRISYILSIIPRLSSRIFRNNLKYIKNKEINQNGWESLKNTYDLMTQAIYDLNIKEHNVQHLRMNQGRDLQD